MPGLGIKRTKRRPRAFEGPPVSAIQDHINPRDRRARKHRASEGRGSVLPRRLDPRGTCLRAAFIDSRLSIRAGTVGPVDLAKKERGQL